MATPETPEAATILRVTFARLHEDRTWDELTVDVPIDQLDKHSEAGDDDWTLGHWARSYLADRGEHRTVVQFAVMYISDNPEES